MKNMKILALTLFACIYLATQPLAGEIEFVFTKANHANQG